MQKVKQLAFALVVSSLLFVSCDKDDDNYDNPPNVGIQPIVMKTSGDSATIANELAAFRTILGEPLNGTPNETTGRREVNWDGAPAAVTNNENFPLDFFNNTAPAGSNGRKRGLLYVDNGTKLRLDSSDFSEIDPSYAGQFEAFSRKKMIIPVGTNISAITFRVAGTTTPATVKGFGVVLSDVDVDGSTYIDFFNGTKSLGTFKAPAAAGSGNYSFLGVYFPAEKITHLKITAGNAALSNGVKDVTDGGNKDLVALDDFLYSEPLAIQ